MEISEAANPYVGPSAFRPDQGNLFFGREREAKKLLALVSSEKAALFYAPSGAGKTSLINARLIPALRGKGVEVLPVARVGGEISSQLRPQNVYVFNMLSYLTGVHEDPARLDPLQEMSLCELFPGDGPRHRRVLILDQFEEILTAHPEHREEREGFFQQVREALEAIPLLSVVFAMREDHIAALDRYAPLLPERLQGRFRMERLRHEAALMAVRRPAEKAGRPFADGVAEKLVDDLRQENIAGADRKIAGEFVEPVQLQVVCYQLWENLRESPGREITAADLEAFGDVDRALEGFFEKAVGRVTRTSGVAERRIVHWFGETLITPARIRNQVHKDAETTGGLPNEAVELLEAEHLIRAERARGVLWYELVHDCFIEPILAAKKRRRKARAAIRSRLMAGVLIGALIASLVVLFARILESERQERAAEALFTVNAVEFSPDSSRLATGGADGTVFLWDCISGRPFLELRGALVHSINFRRPDGGL
ncbi:MAG: hypothetical protein GY856_10475 [bacterium]|nr:hypothetical protein [bacterium]